MVKITDSAKEELKRILTVRSLGPDKYLRLATPPVWTLPGDFGIVVDEERLADEIVYSEGVKILLLDPELSRQLENGVFDYKSTPEGVRFTLDVY